MSIDNTHVEYTLRPIAGFWRRVSAIQIDFLVITLIGLIIGITLGDVLMWLNPMWTRLIGSVITITYFAILNSDIGEGQTIGKRLLKVRVVGVNGRNLSLSMAALRALIFLIPTLLTTFISASVNMLSIAFTVPLLSVLPSVILTFGTLVFLFNSQSRQTIHDILCHTYVVEAWTSGRVIADKASPKMLLSCGLAAVLVVGIPWAIVTNQSANLLEQSNQSDTNSEVSKAIEQIPGVIFAQVIRYLNGELECYINYTGKQSAQEIAEQAIEPLSLGFPGESISIITTKRFDLVSVIWEEASLFLMQPGQPLERRDWRKGIRFGYII